MHVYIFTCELDCIGIGIHAFHMHWNTRGARGMRGARHAGRAACGARGMRGARHAGRAACGARGMTGGATGGHAGRAADGGAMHAARALGARPCAAWACGLAKAMHSMLSDYFWLGWTQYCS